MNRALLAMSGLAILALGVESLRPTPHRALARHLPQGAEPSVTKKKSRVLSMTDVVQRNLFRPLIAPEPPAPKIAAVPLPPPPPKIPLSQRLSHWRLVGIMAEEAVLEDLNSQQTHTFKTDQTVEDDVKISAISSGRVTLSSGEDRYDLTL